MSQYIQFFVKGEKEFVPIGSFSRSSMLFDVFRLVAPYGKVRAIGKPELSQASKDIQLEIDDFRSRINELNKLIDSIATFNNSVQDKLDAIDSLQVEINNLNDDLKTVLYLQSFISTLDEIIDESECFYSSDGECEPQCLYVGVECGNPTEEDIVD